MTDFFEEVADSILETEPMKSKSTALGSVLIASRESVRNALIAAAKMGAEASLSLMPEHDVEMGWVCTVCREAIVAKDIDENHTIWVHAHEQ